MAQKTRPGLQTTIDSNLPDNTTDFITPLLHREVEEDLKDSNFNILDDTAFDVNYTPTTSSDWDVTVPIETGAGLDQLAQRLRDIEDTNYSNNVFYVSKQGNDSTAEEGNEAKPFLTIQAAATAMPSNNSILKVLGGGTYSENVTLKNNSTNCIFDFSNCKINNLTADFSNQETNNNLIKELQVISPTASITIRATWVKNLNITAGNQSIFCYSKFATNCIFTSSNSSVTLGSGTNFFSYFDTCIVLNTGSGSCVKSTVRTIFNNCFIESNTGTAILSRSDANAIDQVVRMYGGSIKSTAWCVSGENGVTNFMGYNVKIYSSASNCVQAGGIGLGGKYLLFDNCEFYTKGANDVFLMNTIERLVTENYTFKSCVFHIVTGFPIQENTYNPGDLGTTLLTNCTYNSATVTSIAPVKVVEHNSFSFPNYTDFNTLQ